MTVHLVAAAAERADGETDPAAAAANRLLVAPASDEPSAAEGDVAPPPSWAPPIHHQRIGWASRLRRTTPRQYTPRGAGPTSASAAALIC